MIGGFNKLLRNLASLKGKNAYDKSLIKATYSGDMKEPKEKHVIFILECLKGRHLGLIRPKEAFTKLFDRFFQNLRSFSLMIKYLIICHRALQEQDISQMVAHKIKEKENLLYPYQNEEQSYGKLKMLLTVVYLDIKMQCFICEMYINYLKNLINFIIICQLFSINVKDLHFYTKNLSHKELFLIFSRIDPLIESILKVFEQKFFCQSYQVLHSIIYLLFVDLLQIYQSYYLLITVMLEKFDEMNLKDAKRAFIIYMNFIKINKEIRKMASCIILEFNIQLSINFYEIDTKVIDILKLSIETKEKEYQSSKSGGGSQSDESSNYNIKSHAHHSPAKKPKQKEQQVYQQIEFKSDEKKQILKRQTMKVQGEQGVQRKCSQAEDSNPFQEEKSDQQELDELQVQKFFTQKTINCQANVLRNQKQPQFGVHNQENNPQISNRFIGQLIKLHKAPEYDDLLDQSPMPSQIIKKQEPVIIAEQVRQEDEKKLKKRISFEDESEEEFKDVMNNNFEEDEDDEIFQSVIYEDPKEEFFEVMQNHYFVQSYQDKADTKKKVDLVDESFQSCT